VASCCECGDEPLCSCAMELVCTSKRTRVITKSNWLMLFKEINAVYSKNHEKLIN
jgi:hypothetical protein